MRGAVPEGSLPWIGRSDATPEDTDSSRAKLVALHLANERSATLADLQAALGEPRLTLLQILGDLVDSGLVERVEGTYHFRDADGRDSVDVEV